MPADLVGTLFCFAGEQFRHWPNTYCGWQDINELAVKRTETEFLLSQAERAQAALDMSKSALGGVGGWGRQM